MQERHKPIKTAQISSLSEVLCHKKYVENKTFKCCSPTGVTKLELICDWSCRSLGIQSTACEGASEPSTGVSPLLLHRLV